MMHSRQEKESPEAPQSAELRETHSLCFTISPKSDLKRLQQPMGIPLQLRPGYDPIFNSLNKFFIVFFAARHEQRVSGSCDSRRSGSLCEP